MTQRRLSSLPDLSPWLIAARAESVVAVATGLAGVVGDLLGWSHVNDILNHRNLSYPQVGVFSAGEYLKEDEFLLREVPRRFSRLRPTVPGLISSGGALFVREVERLSGGVCDFSAELERLTGAAITCEMEVSMACKRKPEWRSCDLLLLQSDGPRKILIYEPTVSFPLSGVCAADEPSTLEPVQSVILDVGDALYLPRGFWFASESIGQPCLALSFSMQGATGFDFARWLVHNIATKHAAMRKDVLAADRSYVGEILRLFISEFQSEDLRAMFLQALHGSVPNENKVELPFQIRNKIDIGDARTLVSLAIPRPLFIGVQASQPDVISVFADGRRLVFRSESVEMLKFLREVGTFALGEFYDRFSATLPLVQLKEFIQDLIDNGILSIVSGRNR